MRRALFRDLDLFFLLALPPFESFQNPYREKRNLGFGDEGQKGRKNGTFYSSSLLRFPRQNSVSPVGARETRNLISDGSRINGQSRVTAPGGGGKAKFREIQTKLFPTVAPVATFGRGIEKFLRLQGSLANFIPKQNSFSFLILPSPSYQIVGKNEAL